MTGRARRSLLGGFLALCPVVTMMVPGLLTSVWYWQEVTAVLLLVGLVGFEYGWFTT